MRETYRRYRLVGDEDGIGIECPEHLVDGRPLAYVDTSGSGWWKDVEGVAAVDGIDGLLCAADEHEREVHGEPVRMTEEVGRAG